MSIPYCYLIGWSKLGKFYYGVRYAKGCNPSDLMKKYKTSSKLVHSFIKEHGHPDVVQIRKTFRCKEKAILHETKVLRRMKVISRNDFLNQTDNRAILLNEESTKRKINSLKKKLNHMSSDDKKEKYGKKWTDERKKRHSTALIGKRWWTNGVESVKAETRPSENWVLGRTYNLSDDGRKKLSEKGKRKYPNRKNTKESNEKRSQALKGRMVSKETRKRQSESLKGRSFSDDHRKNLSATLSDGRLKGRNNPMFGKKHMTGRKHFNNGIIGIMAYECPPGFEPGRLKKI